MGLIRILTRLPVCFICFSLKQMKLNNMKPYLKTTTSKLVENTKAFELTIIKELGKLTP